MKKYLIISDDKTYDLKLLKSLKKGYISLQIENIIHYLTIIKILKMNLIVQ